MAVDDHEPIMTDLKIAAGLIGILICGLADAHLLNKYAEID